MEREGYTALGDLNASDNIDNMFIYDEYVLFELRPPMSLTDSNSNYMLGLELDNQFGSQFTGDNAGAGGPGAYPELEQDPGQSPASGPYYFADQLQGTIPAAQGVYDIAEHNLAALTLTRTPPIRDPGPRAARASERHCFRCSWPQHQYAFAVRH